MPEVGLNDVLIRVDRTGICGTDVHLHKGQLDIPLPIILGHESLGRISALGDSGSKDWLGRPLKIGDRVAYTVGRTCGTCRYCRVHRLPSRCGSNTIRSRKSWPRAR